MENNDNRREPEPDSESVHDLLNTDTDNLNGAAVINAIGELNDSATFEQILNHIASSAQVPPEQMADIVKATLDGGQEYGFLGREGDRYFLHDIDSTVNTRDEVRIELASDSDSETAGQARNGGTRRAAQQQGRSRCRASEQMAPTPNNRRSQTRAPSTANQSQRRRSHEPTPSVSRQPTLRTQRFQPYPQHAIPPSQRSSQPTRSRSRSPHRTDVTGNRRNNSRGPLLASRTPRTP